MSKIQATNNFVFIKRDETQKEVKGLLMPGSAREKPSQGIIVSVGKLVRDKAIREGVKGMFHKGIGFEVEYDNEVYLVLQGEEIIATV